MTPLEELQSAYKRLSEERDAARGVNLSLLPPIGNLIVTLHRTVDAQLALLADGIAATQAGWNGAIYFGPDGDGGIAPSENVVNLARAINGGAA
jgi:hypothetical protein